MLTVINVDAYPFLGFSDLTCHLEDAIEEGVFSHCTVPHNSKKTGLETASERLLH